MKTLFLILAIAAAVPVDAARTFVRASNQFLEVNAPTATAYPITISGWFKTNDLTVNQVIAGNGTTVTGVGVYLFVRGATAGDPLSATDYDGSTSAQANSGGSVSSGTWSHGGAVFSGASSRAVYLNGTKTTNTTTTSTNLAATDRTYTGAFVSGTSQFSGDLAEIAIWNVALTDDEMTSLAAGCSPLRIRPASLQYYAPLWPTIFDYRKGVSITNVNTTTAVADHPRIFQ